MLVVEDDLLVRTIMEDDLRKAGFEIAAAADTLREALRFAVLPVDAAIVDINLAGETSFAVADLLRQRDIPFMSSGKESVSRPLRSAS